MRTAKERHVFEEFVIVNTGNNELRKKSVGRILERAT